MSLEPKQSGPLIASDIARINGMLVSTAVNFVLLGLYTTLVCIALYNLCTKEGAPAARKILIVVTVALFVCSTGGIIERLLGFTIEMYTFGFNPPNVKGVLTKLDIAFSGFDRVTIILSDGIVIWRAWLLWSGSRSIHVVLGVFMFISFAGVSIDYTFVTFSSFGHSNFSASGSRTLILTLPPLCANIVATCLIGYRIWLYRHEVKHNLNTLPNKKTRVEKIMLLLAESGVIYGTIWVLGMSIISQTDIDSPLYDIIDSMWPQFAALYPVVITLLVSLEKMQLDPTLDLPNSSMPIHCSSISRAAGSYDPTANRHSPHLYIGEGSEAENRAVTRESLPSVLT